MKPVWSTKQNHHRQWHSVYKQSLPQFLRRNGHQGVFCLGVLPKKQWASGASKCRSSQGIEDQSIRQVGKQRKNWIEHLPSVLWSLRTTPSRAIGETPFFLVYGAEAVLPSELKYGSPRVLSYDENTQEERRIDDINLLEESRCRASLQSARYQQGLHRYHSRHVRSRELQLGDMVLRKRQKMEGLNKISSK